MDEHEKFFFDLNGYLVVVLLFHTPLIVTFLS